MKWQTAKCAQEIKLAGITAEFEFTNKTVSAVVLKDGNGGSVKFGRENTYSGVPVYVPAVPEMKPAWRLVGSIKGLPVDALFKSKCDAERKLRDLGGDSDELKIEETQREVDESGEVPGAQEVPF